MKIISVGVNDLWYEQGMTKEDLERLKKIRQQVLKQFGPNGTLLSKKGKRR